MKKMQKARAEALEAAVKAVLSGVEKSGVAFSTIEPEEVLTYAKFILGKRPAKKKRRRTKVQGGERPIYVAKWGTPLPRTEEELKDWTPLGYMTEDGLKEDPSFSVADAFRRDARPDLTVPTITGATLEKFAEKVRDGDLAADTEPATTFSPVGEDPGDREVLTQWAEAIRSRNAEQERELEARALEDPEVGETNKSAGAAEWIAERGEALKRGREKLRERRFSRLGRSGPLDGDELLAVAGSEVYPPNDKEPSRERRIRNRKGEVRTYVQRSGSPGWTSAPGDPWSLHLAWTSSEMARRGPWHVV